MQIRSSDNSINVVQESSCAWDLKIPNTQNSLVYGGVVTWLQNYDFNVSAAGYYINGVFYTSPDTIVTLSPADPDLDRIDVIYVDTTGTVQVLTGIPALNPLEPGLDLGLQLRLGIVFVEAGSTSPTIQEECIYQENGEWTSSSSTIAIDPASANTPCIGSVGVEATTASNGDYIKFLRVSPFNPLTDHNVLTFRLKAKADWDNNVNNKLILTFRLAGVIVGTPIIIENGSYGFDFSNITDCQIISIPLVQFNILQIDTVDEFRIEVAAGSSFGWFFDGLCLQGGIFSGFTDSDERVKVSGNDQTTGYLNGKLVAGNGIAFTENNDGGDETLEISVIDQQNALVYGGVVTWLQNYDYNVTAAGYYINSVFYTSPNTNVTLAPADPLLDRIDVIYVDITGTVQVATGVPALNPAQPGLDLGTQLGLGVILVQAASTQPVGAIEECGYVDNGEWTASASDSSINVNSTNTPCSGTKSIEGTTVTTADYFKLIRSSATALLPTFNILHFLIRSKGSWGNKKLNIQWYLAGVPKGVSIAFGNGSYNFISSDVVNCQLISINIQDFSVPQSDTVDELRFTMSGSGNIGFFIDNICVQNNGSQVFPQDNDIHNQFFGPQTPGDFWINGTGRADGWFTSPQRIGITNTFYSGTEKFGLGSWADNNGATVIGFHAEGHGNGGSAAVGAFAYASESASVGYFAHSQDGGVAVGQGSNQTGSGSIAIGGGVLAAGGSAVAIGGNASSSGQRSIALGYYANATDVNSIAIGNLAASLHQNSIAIGMLAETTANRQFIVGGHNIFSDQGMTDLYFGSGVTSPFNFDRFWTITGSEGSNTAGSKWTFAGAKGTGNALSGTFEWQTSDPTVSGTTLQSLTTKMGLNSNTKGLYLQDIRFELDRGIDIVATNDLTLGHDGNGFVITGNTTVNAILNTDWQPGSVIYLIFTGTPTLKHNTVGGAGTLKMQLAGSVDFTAANGDLIAFWNSGSNWHEIGRKVASSGGGSGVLSVDNALTLSTPSNAQWGGTLLHDTTIDGQNLYNVLFTELTDFFVSTLNSAQIGSAGDVILSSNTLGSPAQITLDSVGDIAVVSTAGNVHINNKNDGFFLDNIQSSSSPAYVLVSETSPFSSSVPVKYASVVSLVGGAFTADNGLTKNTSTNVQLFGPVGTPATLLHDSYLDATSNYRLDITGAIGNPNYIFSVTNTSSFGNAIHAITDIGTAINGAATGGTGVNGNSVNGVGGIFSSTNTNGLQVQSTTSVAGIFTVLPSSTNTVVPVMGLYRISSGGAGGDGIGGSLEFYNYSDNSNQRLSNQIISKLTTAADATRTSQLIITGVNSGTLVDKLYIEGEATKINATRFEEYKGADVIAANDLTVGTDGNTFTITGSTQINAITFGNWQPGSRIHLIFTGTPTVKNNTAGGAGTAPIQLSGGLDYAATANDVLSLVYDGTDWHETARKSTGTGTTGILTADNGLTKNTVTNVQLGGTLINGTTTINAGTNLFVGTSTFTDGGTNSAFTFNNTLNTASLTVGLKGTAAGTNSSSAGVVGSHSGSGSGVQGSGVSGAGVIGISSSGNGIEGRSTSGKGLSAQTNSGLAGYIQAFPSSTNTIIDILQLARLSSGTAANGIGGKLTFINEADDGFGYESAGIAGTWGDVTLATRSGTLRNYVTSSAQVIERYSIFGTYKTLTEASATSFVRVNIPSGEVAGGEMLVTVQANDATDFQARTLRFIWSAVNKGGTITKTLSTPEEVFAESAGSSTLSVTIDTNDAGSGNLDFRANATSSLTQTLLRISYQVWKNYGTGVITPQ